MCKSIALFPTLMTKRIFIYEKIREKEVRFFICRDSESSEHWLQDVCQTKKSVERNIIYMAVATLLHHHSNNSVVEIALDALYEQCKIQPHLVKWFFFLVYS